MIIKSKYDGYGQVILKETENTYDFIACVENNTDKVLKLYIDDLEGWYSQPIVIPAHDRIDFFADDEGRGLVESIKNGDFKAVLEYADKSTEKSASPVSEKEHKENDKRATAIRYEDKHVPAENLPVGWIWHHSHNGSGALYSPEGDAYFWFNRSRYSVQHWTQYWENINSRSPKIFQDDFDSFTGFAENYIKEHVLEADRDER